MGVRMRIPLSLARKLLGCCSRHLQIRSASSLIARHVALAQLSGCNWFLSFDTNSNARILAAAGRLKVYPPLSASEKSKIPKAA